MSQSSVVRPDRVRSGATELRPHLVVAPFPGVSPEWGAGVQGWGELRGPFPAPWPGTVPGPGGAAGAGPRGSSPPLGALGPRWPLRGSRAAPVSGDRADGGAGGAGQEGVERAAPAAAAAGATGSAARAFRPAAQGMVALGETLPPGARRPLGAPAPLLPCSPLPGLPLSGPPTLPTCAGILDFEL